MLTKEVIVKAIKKSGCPMLRWLPIDEMTKEDLIQHLQYSCCPILRELMEVRKISET